ncbi:hypothetical protein [Kineosporia succinea]|uniref:Uncharacterized protein n=1 Tax=Kineosporia succinea TaxID=84632 RepID=A0ABT9PB06_9ACTN|nr:hypothetical protein [Kineosporia succinea]MDP9829869.1 hypothetical protein [Kineosporia succinea]
MVTKTGNGSDGCFHRTLGYSVSHYRMLTYSTLSPGVEAPPE